jgi:hypothetical protein
MFNWFNNTWLDCFAQFIGHFVLCPEGLVKGELHAQVHKLGVDTSYSVNTTPENPLKKVVQPRHLVRLLEMGCHIGILELGQEET